MNNQTQERTKGIIINAFIKLLNEKTFLSISIQDICDEAKVHRSTFYRYFVDKFELYNQVVNMIVATLYDHASKNRNHSLVEEVLDYVDANKALVLNITFKNESNELYNSIIKMGAKIIHEKASYMDDVISRKIRESNHPEILCSFYCSGMIEVVKQWVNQEYPYSKNEIVQILNEILA
ncbi:TetR/AcrR family transcriptional regulator [Paenibacillus sp.]|jgi:AcrR family transcriptional regulator|uniref:TetR/AcrR family transcriptional regulator n=1 Tax=Paenibacillus sp. TaxID=58172 RepID=UPI002827908C|nr:TetR/AcrR family transcriptional regulator [Paenibacillus sp.]MDR0270570.1 TetR/AcrR family transcriptional regulator [Paenibacillus sp.]